MLTRVPEYVCLSPRMILEMSAAVAPSNVPHSSWSQHSHPTFCTFPSSSRSIFLLFFPPSVFCSLPQPADNLTLGTASNPLPPLNFATAQLAAASNRNCDSSSSLKLLLKNTGPSFLGIAFWKVPPPTLHRCTSTLFFSVQVDRTQYWPWVIIPCNICFSVHWLISISKTFWGSCLS